MALPNSGAVSSLAEMYRRRRAPPTLGVTFDLGHVLVLAWDRRTLESKQCQLNTSTGTWVGIELTHDFALECAVGVSHDIDGLGRRHNSSSSKLIKVVGTIGNDYCHCRSIIELHSHVV